MDREINPKKENEKTYKSRQRYKKHMRKDQKDAKTEEPASGKKKTVQEPLPSNWARYEINSLDEDSADDVEKANFNTLLDKPVSQASYFKFKNEENWSKNVEFHAQFQKYFTLDINLLNLGVACVKFTERHSYEDDILKNLDGSLEKQLSKYEAYLDKQNVSKKNTQKKDKASVKKKLHEGNLTSPEKLSIVDIKSSSNNVINDTKVSLSIKEDEDIESLFQSENDEVETKKECIDEDPLMTTVVNKTVISNTTEDLEQWLDDILDD